MPNTAELIEFKVGQSEIFSRKKLNLKIVNKFRNCKSYCNSIFTLNCFFKGNKCATDGNETKKEEEIRSDSLVKFEACKPTFFRLQCNTDLNLPPSDWLNDKFGLKQVYQPLHPAGFSR